MTATNLDQLASVWSQVEALAPGLLHPIETEEQYQQALETVDELMTRVNESEGDDPLESLLSILIERVAAYEESILPPSEKNPAGVLAYLMEDRGLTQSALAVETGIDQSTISKLLAEERRFNADHARILGAYFKVGVQAFIPEID
ncbi:helix-turn-helix domain-containing protein [Deinococcus radiophilus]|uniref:helix-turn-helix domain-containing protein n=1 Tax=Deinococcus radiophilus TaxID=32062 RepID=UPI003613BEA3